MPQAPKTHRPFADRRGDDKARDAAAYEKHRGHSGARGYNWKWRKMRVAFLRQHPLCVKCEKAGRVELARVVDHIRPHRGNDALFWDVSNWQPLCRSHHSSKTAAGDGGFGNPDQADSDDD